jgi:DNA-binding GntR family transcriptional regulator
MGVDIRPDGTGVETKQTAISLHEAAYEQIKQEIIMLRFGPGSYLNEAQVSKTLGIGRTPVHQAINRLMLEGLVQIIPRKGFIVKAVSLDEILDIIDVRLLNETYCARLAATHADSKDIAELTENLRLSEAAMSSGDIDRQMMLDRAFHLVLSRASRNPVLGDLLRTLHDRSLRFWFISLRSPAHHSAVRDEHRCILDALVARDADAAAEAIRLHIESFRQNIVRSL